MALLKRFELWLLLILIGGGLYYVLKLPSEKQAQGQRPAIQEKSEIADLSPVAPCFTLKKTTLTRDNDHFLIEIDLLCRNETSSTLKLSAPSTQLLTSGGQEVPPFFLPFQAPQQIPADSEKSITLRYWLNQDSLKGPISLIINEETIKIKNSVFDTDSLAHKESHSFTNANWTPES